MKNIKQNIGWGLLGFVGAAVVLLFILFFKLIYNTSLTGFYTILFILFLMVCVLVGMDLIEQDDW